jgi:hypothetical protein
MLLVAAALSLAVVLSLAGVLGEVLPPSSAITPAIADETLETLV